MLSLNTQTDTRGLVRSFHLFLEATKTPFLLLEVQEGPHSLIGEDGVVVQGELSLDAMAQLRRDVHGLWRERSSQLQPSRPPCSP